MKPALSVIFFTVSSGAGLGLMIWLVLSRLFHAGQASEQWWMAAIASGLLLTIGLFSSTLHLANRKNAWRAFTGFKTSWLSREGVFAVALYPLAAAFLWSVAQQSHAAMQITGVLLIALAFAVLYCTAMIYACLKTVPRWRNWQTKLSYPWFGLMSGALLLLAFVPQARPFARPLVMFLLIGGALIKLSYLIRFSKSEGENVKINEALRPLRKRQPGQVRLLDVGHSAGTFLTNEFMFALARSKAQLLRWVMWLAGFLFPLQVILLFPNAAALAAALCLVGLLCERWLFFAEAQHVVRLYHGQPGI